MSFIMWLVTASALSMSCSASNSILEIINTHQIEKMIAERKSNISRDPFLEQNLLEEGSAEYSEPLRNNVSGDQQEMLSRHGNKLLRSSKSAMLVTRKEYLRKDWCKTEPLAQVIQEDGCTPVNILNRFCYGQCNSFYIPKIPHHRGRASNVESEQSAFKSCAFCKPKLSSWITVTLRCHKKKRATLRRKRIQLVKKCKCVAENIH